MALKLDMSKTYERVEWNFLEKTLVDFGFNLEWINLVMQLRAVETVKKNKLLLKAPKNKNLLRPQKK